MTTELPLHDAARILVIGGSGFVGWNAVRRFCARGNTVGATFLTRTHYLHQVPGCVPLRLDITDGDAVEATFARFQPTLVLHLAARARPQLDTDPAELDLVNVGGSAHIARAASRCGARLIYLSTDVVYPDDAGLCSESTLTSPFRETPYGASKLRGEEAVRSLAPDHVVIRPSVIYGRYGDGWGGFLGRVEEVWSRGERMSVFSDQVRSFVFVGDLLDAIETVAAANNPHRLYVAGGAEGLTRAEFTRRYALHRGLDPDQVLEPMRTSELPGHRGGASDIRLDTARLRSLGWQPHSLEETFVLMDADRGEGG